ncbi:MAG: thioredoxin family protein [Acidobacteriota bacterium]|nr:thioredoxin family protein [Acidobacteriota bacterium]MDE2924492.1 thioredoxin family protein [Acidobacteriota bacterium]MDE3264142.1 thioredoxin family protein [Acidobacteriota bacterium]
MKCCPGLQRIGWGAFAVLLLAGMAALLAHSLAAPATASDTPSDRPDFEGWYEGAAGLAEALEVQRRDRLPLFLYIYTDWCPYCRQFERELLTDDEVDGYLDAVLAVRMNPESGGQESRLAQRFGVRGYPTLVMYSADGETASYVERMEMVDGEPRLMTGRAFLRVLDEAANR